MSKDKLLIDFVGKDLVLEVWDGAILDDDMISIYLNNNILEKEITLKKNKKIINLPGTKDDFELKIVALNTGTMGVNTVNFAVRDTADVKEFASRLNKGESFDMEFRRKRK